MTQKRLNTKLIATLGVFLGLSIAFSFIPHIAILPAAPMMKFDIGDVPIFVVAFMYGPLEAVLLSLLKAVIQLPMGGGGPIGMVMNFLTTAIYSLTAGLIYKFWRTFKGAILALSVALVLTVAMTIPLNIIFIPLYVPKMTHAKVVKMITPAILPFNAIKYSIETVLTLVLYKVTRRGVLFVWKKTDVALEKRKLGDTETVASTLADTEKLAQKLASQLSGGEVILLNGEMGAGKTTFTKFLAKALGITEDVTSPTFNIMKSYENTEGKLKLNHLDMYRLTSEDEIAETGVKETAFSPDAITVIEWNKLQTLPKGATIINIDIASRGETVRAFDIKKSEVLL